MESFILQEARLKLLVETNNVSPKRVKVDGNLDGESVHQLRIVPSKKKQGNGGPLKSVNVDRNHHGECLH